MPSTIFSGSDVKTLKDNLSLNDKAKILPSNGSPAAGAGLAAPIGSLALDYTNGKTYKKIGALATDWSELGSGVGGINYITNTDAESGTAGWSTYADAAGAQPVDGTGGTPNVTWTRSTTTPLRGTADFNFAKDAANRQGEGVSTDMTINLADQAKVLTVSFDYEVLSGTYATGDLTVYLIQDPAGTPVVIQPAGYQILSATAGTKMKQIATFQTASSGQTYRLCFHVASTSASAYTLAIDNVIVGPQVVQYGAPVTDATSFTCTGSWTSNSTYTAFQRRVGDRLIVEGKIVLSGAPTSAALTINLPAGLSIDTAKIGTESGNGTVGSWSGNDTGLMTYLGAIRYNNTTSVLCITGEASSTYLRTGAVDQATPFTWGSTDYLNFKYDVPILGWSSTVQMSNDTDTRVVSFVGSVGSGQVLTGATTNVSVTSIKDSHGAWSGSVYTVQVPGDYVVSGELYTNAAAQTPQAYKNGAAVSFGTWSTGSSSVTGAGSILIPNCVAGDTISLRSTQNGTVTSAYLSIYRLSGPSAIASSETVAMRAFKTTGSHTNNGDYQTVASWNAAPFDTHGAFNVTTGEYTLPISGTFEVSCNIAFAANATGLRGLRIQLDGSSVAGGNITAPGTASFEPGLVTSSLVRGTAGQKITVIAYQSSGGNLAYASATNFNQLSIHRVGN